MSKPTPIFAQMPPHIQENIIRNMDIKSMFCLRKCSRSLRFEADRIPTSYNRINILFDYDLLKMDLFTETEKISIDYRSLEHPDHIRTSVIDFLSIIGNPRVTVETLHFEMKVTSFWPVYHYDPEERTHRLVTPARYSTDQFISDKRHFFDYLTFFSEVPGRMMNVKVFDCHLNGTEEELMRIVPLMRSGVLEAIYLGSLQPNEKFDEISSTDQWKQASKVCVMSENVRIEQLAHFTWIRVLDKQLSVDEVKLLIQTALNHAGNFKQCEFDVSRRNSAVRNYLRGLDNIIDHPSDKSVRFRVALEEDQLFITRLGVWTD